MTVRSCAPSKDNLRDACHVPVSLLGTDETKVYLRKPMKLASNARPANTNIDSTTKCSTVGTAPLVAGVWALAENDNNNTVVIRHNFFISTPINYKAVCYKQRQQTDSKELYNQVSLNKVFTQLIDIAFGHNSTTIHNDKFIGNLFYKRQFLFNE